jgi:DNA-binding MarR family transcriptional regulator
MLYTKAARVFTDLVLETFRLNGRLLLAGDRIARPFALTSSRWQVLGAIEDQPMSVAQIARKMGLARQNVQRLADVLRKEGLIHYAPNPKHLRAKLVCLTSRGTRAIQALSERQAQWANRIVSSVSSKEIEAALSTLTKLRALLDTDNGNMK